MKRKCYIIDVTQSLVVCLICQPSGLRPLGFACTYQADHLCLCYNCYMYHSLSWYISNVPRIEPLMSPTQSDICKGYIPGLGALPDVCTRLPTGVQHPRASAHISGKARGPRAWDITNMLHFLHSTFLNLCPVNLSICFAYIVGDTNCDCGFIF